MRTSLAPYSTPGFDMNVAPPPFIPIEKLIAQSDFSYATLAATVNTVPFEPSYLGDRKLYYYRGVPTRTVLIEFDGQSINLVQSSAPMSPGRATVRSTRSAVPVNAPRLAETITVTASEVATIRSMGSVELEAVETDASWKLKNAIRNIRSTWEWQRVNAAMGILLDADSTVLANYFTLLGVTQPTYDMAWGTAGVLMLTKCANILNMLEDALGDLVPGSPPIVICGRGFWEKFITDSGVQTAYTYFEANRQRLFPTRDDTRYDDFEFGGIIWRQYRGKAGSNFFVPNAEAQLIVDGLPGTYLGYFCAPEDIIDAVNKPGLPFYMTVEEMDHKGGLEFRIQSNPVHIMARPSAAIQLFSSN